MGETRRNTNLHTFNILHIITISLFLNIFDCYNFWHGHKGGWWEERRPRSIISRPCHADREGGKLSGPVYCTMEPNMFIFSKLLLHIFYLLTFSQVNISWPTMLPPISCPGRRREGWAYHADRFETGYCAQAMIIFHLIKFSFFSILDVPFITQTYRCCLCLV